MSERETLFLLHLQPQKMASFSQCQCGPSKMVGTFLALFGLRTRRDQKFFPPVGWCASTSQEPEFSGSGSFS